MFPLPPIKRINDIKKKGGLKKHKEHFRQLFQMGDLWLLPFVLNDPFILRAKVDGTKIVQKVKPQVWI